jgi:hypothetical protein
MGYIKIPIDVDPPTLAQSVFDYITNQAPLWIPNDANLDVWIIRAVTQLASENRSIASDVQDDIFRYFGATLVGLPPINAVSATATTTWTLIDSYGHTIPAGTLVGVYDALGNSVPFQTVSDVTVPAGSTATGAGAVTISAIQPGSAGSGLGAAGASVTLIDVLDWVQGITLNGPTAGGVDDEVDADYLNRLVVRLQGLSQRPILPADFAAMALQADTAVYRAVAIDGFNPADSTYNNQRMVAVAAVDQGGNAVAANVKTEIQTLLQANREVNFVVNVIDPKFTTINIVTSIHVLTGSDPAATDSAVTGAIHNMLDPANWGIDPTFTDSTSQRTWVETPTVYYNEVITAISNAQGVGRVISLTINGGTADVALATPAALTTVGIVTITHA